MSSTDLTRGEALDLIDEAAAETDGTEARSSLDRATALRKLAEHWDIAGNWNENVTADEWVEVLREHVDTLATGDDQRSNGPKDSDSTGLTAP